MVSTEQAELSADHNSAVNSSDLVMQAMMLLQEAHPNRIGQAEELVGIMSSLGVDEQTIAAGVLFEGFGTNNGSRLDLVSERSDAAVFRLVQEVVRIENKRLDWIAVASEEDKSKNELAVSMMLMSMMKDPRVVFIMLAHQLRVIRHAKRSGEEIKKRVALETQQVFVPLANRLGIGQVKWELEDLSFRYLHPQQYKDIAKALEERRVVRESYMQSVVKKIGSLLQEEGLRAQVYGRPKHIFSIWKKMQNKHLDFSELYDVRAVRIVVSDVAACYEALSIVHNAWQLIPEEYDDYIAAPKQNGYQSLHTAVVGPENKTLEVQIRTHSMHQQAELGVAAHWRYKEGGKSVLESQSTINAIRDALSKENELSPASEAITSSKIYVLSPKGRVIELPKGATPLDFAYRIHTDVGHRCRGAKVNGKMVPLTTELSSGQQVEVMTGKEPQPSRDWLSPKSGYLKSTQALNKVRHWFKQQFREEHTNEGKAALLRELGEKRLSSDLLSFLSQKFNYTVEDDFFAAIGRGDLGIQQVVNAIPVEEEQTEQTEIATTSKGIAHQRSESVELHGVGNLLTQLSRCCKPIPGDEIEGFITRGRGITVHRADCQNLLSLKREHAERVVPVVWAGVHQKLFEVDVEIVSNDRPGVLKDITAVLVAEHINIAAVNTLSNRKKRETRIKMTVEISDYEQLGRFLSKLKDLSDVHSATRVVG